MNNNKTKCKHMQLTCKYLNGEDGSCSIGVNGGYCLPIWEGTDCGKSVIKKKTVEGATFIEVIASINRMLERTEDICKEMWDATREECQLRNAGETEEIIMCGYPERINSTNKNNCTYESCPLIWRLYV